MSPTPPVLAQQHQHRHHHQPRHQHHHHHCHPHSPPHTNTIGSAPFVGHHPVSSASASESTTAIANRSYFDRNSSRVPPAAFLTSAEEETSSTASLQSPAAASSPSISSSSPAHYLHPFHPDPARQTTPTQPSSKAHHTPSAKLPSHRPSHQQPRIPSRLQRSTPPLIAPDHNCPEYFSFDLKTYSFNRNSTPSDPFQGTAPQQQTQTRTSASPEIRIATANSPAISPFVLHSSSSSASTPSPVRSQGVSNHSSCSATHSLSAMPPVTQFRQGSTNIGPSPSWEPYPKGAVVSRRESLHRSPHSQSSQYSPSSLSSFKSPPTSAPTLLPSMTPVSPALEDLNLQEMSGNTVSELLEQALKVNGDKNAVLLLDMRPAVCKVVSSIKTAVGVSVSNMLLRRPMYSLDMLTEQLTTQREIQAFSNWRQFANIVLFDATGTVPAKGTPMFCIAQKLRKEGYSARLGYIRGGYNAFAHEHASLCCCSNDGRTPGKPELGSRGSKRSNSSSEAVPKTTSPFRSRLHLGSLPKMMIKPTESGSTVCETPMMENPNVNPLFESVRQAMGLNTNITEEVPVRFPPDFSLNSIRDRLPVWLLNAIDIRSGKKVLAEYFQKVEIGEKKRLALLTAPQEMRSNRTTDLSICAGLEKGLKNRYNHVWPFDHTRVRIKECENGEDDYINASFLEPPFGQKRYIGAQAPLPSTFQDFWKVIWEQESWVIVMLTREFEAGRVKCHKYWPTSEQPVMELGPLRVTFLSEYRVEPDNDSILVRHMQLRHLHRSEDSVRVITQIQYTGWPDFGVPDTPMDVLKVIQLANDHGVPASAGPMMVHCSAGCGRTGAFCVIDSVLADLKTHPETVMGETDVIFASVNRLREQRLSMVQCLRQFVFCYEAILWRLAVPLTRNNNRLQLSLPRKGLVPQTPSLSFPRRISITQPALSRGIAPATTTNKEFSFFA